MFVKCFDFEFVAQLLMLLWKGDWLCRKFIYTDCYQLSCIEVIMTITI